MRTLTAIAALAALVGPLTAVADNWKDQSGQERGKLAKDSYRDAPIFYGPPPPVYGPRKVVTSSHLPSAGECRLWYLDLPAGQQPPPFRC